MFDVAIDSTQRRKSSLVFQFTMTIESSGWGMSDTVQLVLASHSRAIILDEWPFCVTTN